MDFNIGNISAVIISLPTSSLINDVTYKENLGAFVVVGATTSSVPNNPPVDKC